MKSQFSVAVATLVSVAKCVARESTNRTGRCRPVLWRRTLRATSARLHRQGGNAVLEPRAANFLTSAFRRLTWSAAASR
jgi:hypothetical protein